MRVRVCVRAAALFCSWAEEPGRETGPAAMGHPSWGSSMGSCTGSGYLWGSGFLYNTILLSYGSMASPCSVVNPQRKPTWEDILCFARTSRENGLMHPTPDVYYTKPMLLPHEGWPMAAGPVSRPSFSARGQNRAAALTNTRTRTSPSRSSRHEQIWSW